MSDSPRSSLVVPPRPRSPWQLFYGAVHAARRWFWAPRAVRLPVPVVSVGNLCWGGAGKTPLVAALAAHLRDRGLAVAILSRGYGRRSHGIQLVSTGAGPLLGPQLAGDEPVELAARLPGVGVIVGEDRVAAGRHALGRLDPAPQVLILDDGFSHVRLARDLDLLAFPAADPFAGGRLPPAGRLREPLASARHAHAVLLTGTWAGADGGELAAALAPFGFRGPGFASRTTSGPALLERGVTLPPGSRVLLVCGIARPERFAATARAAGFVIAGEQTFADHHDYPETTLASLRASFQASGAAAVLTTAKDAVKLRGRLGVPLADLPVAAEPEPAFWAWLDARLLAAR